MESRAVVAPFNGFILLVCSFSFHKKCNLLILIVTFVSTGNTWDVCGNGTGAVGCGKQETFKNCADVAIITNTGGFGPTGIVPAAPNNVFDNPYAIRIVNITQKGVEEKTLVVRLVEQNI